MIRYATLAMLMTPVAAAAAPVSLQCTLDDRGKPVPMELQLNEADGTASFLWPATGMSVKKSATFTPKLVRFGDFAVDRVSLGIVRDNSSINGSSSSLPAETHGSCKILEVKRAF